MKSYAFSKVFGVIILTTIATACTSIAGDDAAAGAALTEDPSVAKLRSLSGYDGLPTNDKDVLERLVGQPLNTISEKARERVDALSRDAVFPTLSHEQQQKELLALEAPLQDQMPYAQASGAFIMPVETVTFELGTPRLSTRIGAAPPKNDVELAAKAVKLLDPNAQHTAEDLIGPGDFQDLSEACAEYTVRFREGDTLAITAPLINGATPDPKASFEGAADEDSAGEPLVAPSVEFVAQALSALPTANRRVLDQVDIHQKRSPQDKAFAIAQHRPSLRAAGVAMVYPIGVIGVFPRLKSQPYDAVDLPQTFAHEGGHVWTYKRGTLNPDTTEWKAWKAAIAADRLRPSWYASLNFLEDSAESVLLFTAAANLPDRKRARAFYAEFRAMFPSRASVIEAYFPGFTPP
jgi:hypothetical protein